MEIRPSCQAWGCGMSWSLALGHCRSSFSMVSWGSPTSPYCYPTYWRVYTHAVFMLREARSCISSCPTSQPKGQTGAGDRWSQIQPGLACLISHEQPRCQVPEAQAARTTARVLLLPVAGYGVGQHLPGTPCGPSSL